MKDSCDLCEKEYITVDGSKGQGNVDSLMLNDYLTMTDWYKENSDENFKIKRPNPYACRRCIQILVDEGLEDFIGSAGYDLNIFLTKDEWWE